MALETNLALDRIEIDIARIEAGGAGDVQDAISALDALAVEFPPVAASAHYFVGAIGTKQRIAKLQARANALA